MKALNSKEIWFITGSQHLYGEETLKQVNAHSKEIAEYFDSNDTLPCRVIFKPVVTTSGEIYKVFEEANADSKCIGIITWMHTFSPSKMWIAGFNILNKPLLHLHTQYNRDIPWDNIDMDFMNLNQSAHGDKEHGFICTRMGISRKVVVGYWKDEKVLQRIGIWMRAAAAWNESKNLKVARFGDNMREVAVTEGDKVEAQIKLGWSVNGYGVGDLVEYINAVSDEEIEQLMKEYSEKYEISPETQSNEAKVAAIREQAKIEAGMKRFLDEGGFGAFTTTFEDLHGLKQLPGLAVQRLMEQGKGFGGEGDWKTAALTRIMKVMATGLKGGTSFMEDYTYHFEPENEMVLGAHMLEVCPTLASGKPKIEVHPLGIGGKEDPARIVFDGSEGKAVGVTIIDMGNRFRMVVAEFNMVKVETSMPKLPVARVLWKPEPDLQTAAEAWILAGGAHHTCLSYALTAEHLSDFAEMAGMEFILINKDTNIHALKNELRLNDLMWKLKD
ncbi:L-arabinose isomerase [Butyricicoccus intestinisimiae]|jgi:L-arabinose isomerase|uniref:L-arabinose isomerase n=1 Tax=Butyricicoccus intestinisimiae TaxID=2841509 RepID=UPI003D8D84AC